LGGFESPKFNLLQKRLCRKTHPPILKSALEMYSLLEELKLVEEFMHISWKKLNHLEEEVLISEQEVHAGACRSVNPFSLHFEQ
jgi:hypothetical protein